MHEDREFRELNIAEVLPNRFQPRFKFEQDSLDQLAESISKFGVIEPVVVRQVGKKYEIIAGERRYKASKIAGKSTIPAIIINMSDKDSEELALLENVQRKSLNPIEEAVSYKRILDAGYITREELAKKIGKPQTEILSKIRLLNLSDDVQSYLLNNKISERHARSLLKLTNKDKQIEMLNRIVNERLTVKQTDKEIKKIIENNLKEDVETLSVNERGNKMDLDKIMNEAQDINVASEPSQPAPDLMAKGLEIPNEPIVSQNEPVVNGDNKFIGVAPQTAEPITQPSETVAADSSAFDKMFNQPITTEDLPFSQPVMPAEPTSEISAAPAEVNVDSNIPDMNIFQNNVANNDLNSSFQPEPVVVPEAPASFEAPAQPEPVVAPEAPISFEAPAQPEPVAASEALASFETPAQPEPVAASEAPISFEAPVQPEPMVTPAQDFMAVIQMLRDCANQIQNNGRIVNVEETDLGGQYKVTITINK